MILSNEFDFVKYSPFKEIEDKIEKRKNESEDRKSLINKTFEIIKENPFNEKIIDLLLNEKWTCDFDSYINCCLTEKKLIKLEKELTSQGKIYDFYERDLAFMHELNHSWYSRFKVCGQECLSDKPLAYLEFENRLMNEYTSRKNRANPWILKKAIESFGLEPQIYDVSSKMAFEDNSNVKISPLAERDNSLLKIIFMDGRRYY